MVELFSEFDSGDRGNEPIVPNVPVIKFKRLVPIVYRPSANPATLSKISN